MSSTSGTGMAQRLATMAAMQIGHNIQVHPQWASQGHEYYRAVWVECAELLDHFGWKWWKDQRPDLDQVKLEIVDIWHFGLSELLRRGDTPAVIARSLAAALSKAPAMDFRLAVEALAESSLANRTFPMDAFAAVLLALPLGFDELYRLYVGKNVLNRFRQDNGYSTGAYRKIWADGREDNEHLAELGAQLDAGAASFPVDLEAALVQRYAETSSS